jgi:hypothetical protein
MPGRAPRPEGRPRVKIKLRLSLRGGRSARIVFSLTWSERVAQLRRCGPPRKSQSGASAEARRDLKGVLPPKGSDGRSKTIRESPLQALPFRFWALA